MAQQLQHDTFLGIDLGSKTPVAPRCATWSRSAVGVTAAVPAQAVGGSEAGQQFASGLVSGSSAGQVGHVLRAEAAAFVPAVPDLAMTTRMPKRGLEVAASGVALQTISSAYYVDAATTFAAL